MRILVDIILAALLALATPADALRLTAPAYLTHEAAIEHRFSAAIAGAAFAIDHNLLLAIAFRESRYSYRERTRETNGWSCGAMTPTPTRNAALCIWASSSPLNGYLHGAEHLRKWLNVARGNMRAAHLGYAGGFLLIRYCSNPTNNVDYRCHVPAIAEARAVWIRDGVKP